MKKRTKRYCKGLFFLLLSLFLASSEASGFDDSDVRHIGYPAWFKENPFNDLTEVVDESVASGKKGLMVLFTTQGCSYCDLFIRESLGDSDIASTLQRDFESVGFEIFDDTEMSTPDGETKSIKQFATDERVQFSPTILFYGGNGKRILRMTGYQSPDRFRKILDYVAQGHYRSASLRDYLSAEETATAVVEKPDRVGTALKPDPMFEEPPYALDRSRFPADSPLLVIFEKLDCAGCETFHAEVLSKNEVRDTLQRFEVVRLDAMDDETPVLAPDGGKTTPAQWYDKSEFTQAPALLFLDENGKEALKTDALVLHQRMMNSLNYVLEKAYEKGWSYQRFARSKAIERFQNKK